MAHGQTKALPELLTNGAVVAEVLNVTRRRVSQLVTEQVIPAPVNHKYNVLECAAAYIKFKNANAQQDSGSSAEELRKARAELLRAQKKAADLVYKQKTGELLDIEDVQIVVNEGAAIFTGQKRSMGSRLAGQLAGMSDPRAILKLLNAENDAILHDLSVKLSALADRANG